MDYEAYVITIMDNERSVQAANRCIRTAKNAGGIDVTMYPAITPKDDPRSIMLERNINLEAFEEKYSRTLNCMAAFLSHYSLWEKAAVSGKTTIIFEHDAYITGEIPYYKPFTGCATFSTPSYGKFATPRHFGAGPLVQKPYFGGAHGYMINSTGAWSLIETAQGRAAPTDVYLNKMNFPWIQEFYPWVCEARDDFTTIQRVEGCTAKHRYDESYRIENVK